MKTKTKSKPHPKLPPLTTAKPAPKMRRGFNAISKERQRQIASLGGKAISKDRKHMALIGGIGGANSHGNTNSRKARA